MTAVEEYEHDPFRCASGECAHAVSPRLPCRCPDCDATTRAMVAGYRNEAASGAVDLRSQTTPRFAQRTFDRFIQDQDNFAAVTAAEAVAADPTRGLGLYGDPGLGKSHLGAAIANACMARGVPARYIGVEELLSRVRATYDARPRSGGDTEDAMIRAYAQIPVLVLDDFGKESLSDWTVRMLFSIINRRYEQNLPLVVTSNHTPVELASRLVARDADQRTYASMMDRVREMTGTWVAISGRSRR